MPPNTVNANAQVPTAANDSSTVEGIQQENFVSQIPFGNETSGKCRSICDHIPASSPARDFGANALTRLKDCIDNSKPLVSFSSIRGLRNCAALLGNTSYDSEPPARKPSLLQHCLQLTQFDPESGDSTPIALGDGYTLMGFEPDDSDSTDVPSIRGKLVLINAQNERVEIDVLELAPPFDGVAIKSEDLLNCHALLRQTKQTLKQADSNALFASANGIGRSASLLVLSRFEQELVNGNRVCTQDPHTMVDQIIAQGRAVRGPNFVHSLAQEIELKDACAQLTGRYIALKTPAQAAPPPAAEEIPAPPAPPASGSATEEVQPASTPNEEPGLEPEAEPKLITEEQEAPEVQLPTEAQAQSPTVITSNRSPSPAPQVTVQTEQVDNDDADSIVPPPSFDSPDAAAAPPQAAPPQAAPPQAAPPQAAPPQAAPPQAAPPQTEATTPTISKRTRGVLSFLRKKQAGASPDTPTALNEARAKIRMAQNDAKAHKKLAMIFQGQNNNKPNLGNFHDAIRELTNGKKEKHWIWFVFPQLTHPDMGDFAKQFAFASETEAEKYLANDNLSKRLQKATDLLLKPRNLSLGIEKIMPNPVDRKKLHASMTLFSHVDAANKSSPFQAVLNAHFKGEKDSDTVALLGKRAEF